MSCSIPLVGPRTLVTLLLLIGGIFQANGEVIRLSEPVSSNASSETFGALLPQGSEVVGLAKIMSQPSQYVDQSVVISVRVDQVCQKKGCFFIAQDGDSMVRVAFKDYAFFVPTDIAGRRVTLAGELKRRDLSPEQAQHYAADLGGSDQVIETGLVYEIVASAVQVPTSTDG